MTSSTTAMGNSQSLETIESQISKINDLENSEPLKTKVTAKVAKEASLDDADDNFEEEDKIVDRFSGEDDADLGIDLSSAALNTVHTLSEEEE